MSVSVQFAADMETCTGCNEEGGFTLLHLVSASGTVQYPSLPFSTLLERQPSFSWKSEKNGYAEKRKWAVWWFHILKFRSNNTKAWRPQVPERKKDNQKGTYTFIPDEGYIKYNAPGNHILNATGRIWRVGILFLDSVNSQHQKIGASHQQLASHLSQHAHTHTIFKCLKCFIHTMKKFNFAQL